MPNNDKPLVIRRSRLKILSDRRHHPPAGEEVLLDRVPKPVQRILDLGTWSAPFLTQNRSPLDYLIAPHALIPVKYLLSRVQ
jgi:hypothetical protein